eukprot:COSAG02_NODE_46226_length_350_cov_1.637450_1_plen_36_part_10
MPDVDAYPRSRPIEKFDPPEHTCAGVPRLAMPNLTL